MITQFELIHSQDEMLKSKDLIKSLSSYISTSFAEKPLTYLEDIFEEFTKYDVIFKDRIVGDVMFGILDVYEDLVQDAFKIIQLFNELNCISNKKLIILSFIEILKKDSSLKQKILEEINFLAFENSLQDWQFLKDAIKEINDKFPS